jgi:hypothetical protein
MIAAAGTFLFNKGCLADERLNGQAGLKLE